MPWWVTTAPGRPGVLGRLDQGRLHDVEGEHAHAIARRPLANGAYANRYRDENVPEDYRVRFIPYDWTLNQK